MIDIETVELERVCGKEAIYLAPGFVNKFCYDHNKFVQEPGRADAACPRCLGGRALGSDMVGALCCTSSTTEDLTSSLCKLCGRTLFGKLKPFCTSCWVCTMQPAKT